MFRQIFLFLQLSHYFFLKTKEQPLPPFLSHLHFHGYLLFVPPSEYHLGALSFAGTQGQLGCRARQQRGCWVPFVTGRSGSGTRVLWGRKLAEVAILYCCTFLFFFFFLEKNMIGFVWIGCLRPGSVCLCGRPFALTPRSRLGHTEGETLPAIS